MLSDPTAPQGTTKHLCSFMFDCSEINKKIPSFIHWERSIISEYSIVLFTFFFVRGCQCGGFSFVYKCSVCGLVCRDIVSVSVSVSVVILLVLV